MKSLLFESQLIIDYKLHLYQEEKSTTTIRKYIHDIEHFFQFLPSDKLITKERIVLYKQELQTMYKATSVNSMLSAINSFLKYMDASTLQVKLMKIQKQVFSNQQKELSKKEYKRLLDAAKEKENQQLYVLLQTLCATGIRVSEHAYITVESLREGKAVINNKGKVREIYISKPLRKLLKTYCRMQHIQSGSIFITKNGRLLDRSNIWKMMKRLCVDAKVDPKKVFPHNLRHLFAHTYYQLEKDLVKLASLLGHSSIETTRVYTMTTGANCAILLTKMNLVYTE